eukprot:3595560-Alexandrium_andersonii.AAC.1
MAQQVQAEIDRITPAQPQASPKKVYDLADRHFECCREENIRRQGGVDALKAKLEEAEEERK